MFLKDEREMSDYLLKIAMEDARLYRNKDAFYAHYQDIYALANAMEDEMVHAVAALRGLPIIRKWNALAFPGW